MSAKLPPKILSIINTARATAQTWRYGTVLEIIQIELRAEGVQAQDILPFVDLEYQHRCNRLAPEDRCFELAMTGLLVSHLDKLMVQIDSPPQYVRAASGKPRLLGNTPQTVSWSRSSPWLTIGLAGPGELGIDVEVRRPIDFQSILPTICNDAERTTFHTVPPSAQSKRFYAIWTLKEAILKAIGTGFQESARKIILPQSAFAATPTAPSNLVCLERTFEVALLEHEKTTIAIARLRD